MKTLILLIIIPIIFILGCNPENINSNKTEINKIESAAFNKELIINIDGDSIAGYAFIASGDTIKETVILIAGFPGNDNSHDIAQEIRRNGKNVIHFNHRGAWGSQGEYSYSNCLEDIGKLIEFLSQEKIAADLRIDSSQFTLLGRSYGGGIALIKGSQINSVKKIIAVSSFNYGDEIGKYDTIEELDRFKKYTRKQIMIHCDVDDFFQEIWDNKKEFNVLSHKDRIADKKVLIIEDTEKNQHWVSQLENAESVIMESDHNFINERIELTELIVNWLNKS